MDGGEGLRSGACGLGTFTAPADSIFVLFVARVCYRDLLDAGEDGMVKTVTVRRMGGSLGTTLPKDMVERLNLGPGDKIFAVETEGGILLTPYNPEFDEAMRLYERAASKYKNALRELAE